MKLTFLGTGTSGGVPIIGCDCETCNSTDPKDKRLRTSAFVEVDDLKLCIDIGPDFRTQMINNQLDDVDAILITHAHRDHVAGLDEVRAINFIRKKPIPIYIDKIAFEDLKGQFAYIFDDNPYPGIPQIDIRVIDNNPFTIGDTEIIPIEVMHYKLPVKGFRIGSLAYITDANFIADKEMEKLSNLDVLVLNALRREKHISHFTLAQALEIVNKIGASSTYLTHISHQMGLHNTVEQELPGGVRLAYDSLVVSID